MNKIDILNDFKGKTSELSKLIKSWNLIDVSSKNSFDKLSEKILNTLYEGQTELKVKRIIESELCVTYGLFSTDFDSEKLTKDIMSWWHGKS
jgi:hypothetical protein